MSYENLPAVTTEGFGLVDPSERLIQGDILKCVDGRYSTRSGENFPLGKQLLAIKTARALQQWEDNPVDTIVEQIGEPFPDIDELNAAIPKEEWEEGLNGEPRPPWQLQFVVYLIDPRDGGVLTYINSTAGARVAYDQLRSRVTNMQALSGKQLVPVIELDTRVVSKAYNKIGPHFKIVRWLELGGQAQAAPRLIEHSARVVEPTRQKKRTDPARWDDASDNEPDVRTAPFNDDEG